AALLSAMAGALVAAMTVLGRWDRLALALGLLGLAGGLWLLAWHHLRARAAQGRQAMYPVALLGQRALWTGTLMTVCYASANGSFLVIFNVGLQHGRGHSAFEAGLLHLPFSLGVMAGVTLLARRWLVRHGRRVLAGGAVLAALGGSAVMTVLAMRGWPVAWALPAIVVAGVGVGLTSSSVAPVTLAWVDVRHAGMAAATLRLGQQVGAALGSAVIVRPYFAQQGSVSGGSSHWGEIAAIAPLLALLGLAALLALTLPLPLFPPPGGAARR
ncbi:MAG TPA: hypothetical protein VN222_01335, partial [Novosphingobium sp.]|nr:hypothetical protein [Novosphingobium sp.]